MTERGRGAPFDIPWHPIAFGVAYVSLYWVESAVSPYAAFRSLIVVIASIGLIQGAFSIALRDAGRGALLTSAIVLAAMSKVLVQTLIDAPEALGAPLAIIWFGAIALALVLAVRIARQWIARWSVPTANRTLNIFSAALVGVAVASAISTGRVAMAIDDFSQGATWTPSSEGGDDETLDDGPVAQDIYVLLLDGYPGRKALDRVFGFDNSPFLEGMEQRGFDVAQDSRSNYLWTHLTLMSMLHRDFIERMPEMESSLRSPTAPIHPLVREVINGNPTFEDFRAAGYAIYATLNPMERYAMRGADVLLDEGRMNEFELSLLIGTYAGDIVEWLSPSFGPEQHRLRILDALDALPQLAARSDGVPKFVFAHVISPHHPVLWDAAGAPVNPSILEAFYGDTLVEQNTTREEFINGYVGQVAYLNQLVLETIDEIQAAARDTGQAPSIIVMSDHGSGLGIEPERAYAGDTDERTDNFIAALTPGHESLFPENITPVDVMRLLSDAYLDTAFGKVEPLAEGLHTSPDEIGD